MALERHPGGRCEARRIAGPPRTCASALQSGATGALPSARGEQMTDVDETAEQDTLFLREAIRLSRTRMRQGRGGPFGAVVAKDGVIVARGWNAVTSSLDPTAHAEVVAIRRACRRLGAFHLGGCVLYTSCEPCPMCLAAAYWARVERLVYAATRDDAARAGFDDARIYREVPLTPEARSLPTDNLLRGEAISVLEEWLAKPDRVTY
jgi:guanine deaminase